MSKRNSAPPKSNAAPNPALLSSTTAGPFSNHLNRAIYGSGALVFALQSGLAFADVAAATDPAVSDASSTVIVTGTRTTGMKAVDSPSPIQVIDGSALERTGQPDLIAAISLLLPSFTAQAVGGDTANLTLSARLRGLSSNDTLVLINGKRRHGTANLAVLGGPYQGGAAADLNYIPVSAIDHIEVLSDGAAAQYGTDAIAGVVNIILKKDDSGGSIGVTGGRYLDGGGKTGDISLNKGFALNEDGFVNVTVEDRYHGHSSRGGIDPRVINPANIAQYPTLLQFPGYPYMNQISGDAEYHLALVSVNSGYNINNETQVYAFGTAGHKDAAAFENYRMPYKLPTIYPNGFNPQETLKENDFALTLGIKGKFFSDWTWDLSSTYGKDTDNIGVANSGNISLFNDTGSTPTNFHAGNFIASQWTQTLDIGHEFALGLATPVSFAAGLERRKDTYGIDAGDAGSTYKEGSQSYPGFLQSDAGNYSRDNTAVYADFAGSPVAALKLDAAARYEKYSDFGNTTVGKLTGRYDFTPSIGLRSTISTGFRAPTLAEERYTSTNVSPTSAYVQLAPNSVGATSVGINGLKPEKSTNYSLGLVVQPTTTTLFTVDAYQISIKDRIVGSGTLYSSGGAINSPAVTAAILANGNVLDASVAKTGINIFSNAADTRTKGLDVLYSIASNFGEYGRVDWTIAGSYNKTEITKINQAPSQLAPQVLLDATALSDLTTASPKYRINLGGLWKIGSWAINARETIYGSSSEMGTENGGTYYETTIATKAITDLEIANHLTKSLTVSIGANNLFNQYPTGVNPQLLAAQRAAGDNAAVGVLPSFSPFGINGAYYYAKMAYTF